MTTIATRRLGSYFLIGLLMLSVLPLVNAVDTDGDGIEDHLDDCPLAIGNSSVDKMGCPDWDNDGTSDWNDRISISNAHFLSQQTIGSSYDYISVDHSPNGDFIITGDENGWVRIWNTSAHFNSISAPQMTGETAQVAWSPEGSMVAATNDDDELHIWWASNMTSIHSTISVDVGGSDFAGNLAFNNDGTLIAVAIGRSGNSGTSGQVKIINTSSGLEERSLNPTGEDRFDSVAWSPDGSRIAIGGNDDMWIYETTNWQINRSMTGVASSTIADLAWSPDGNYISACESWGGSNSRARLFSSASGVKLWEKTHSSSCLSTDFSPDSRLVAYSISYYQTDGASVKIYASDSGVADDTFSAPRPNGCSGSSGNQCGTVYGLSWASDGQHIVTGHGRNDEGLYFWHIDLDPDSDGWNTTDQGDGKVDHFPLEPSQWNDTDGDGYGDRAAPAHQPDSCPLVFGLSIHDRFGCPDTDGDGVSDQDSGWGIDDGADAFPLDHLQWTDSDLDGYGDNYYFTTGNPPNELHINQSGDAFPYDNTQWNDTDGDGKGDNYENHSWATQFRCNEEVGCVGALQQVANESDAFPLDHYQWIDSDGDWFGDQPNTPRSDACPYEFGNSTYDRLGCADSDGDGYSNEDGNWQASPNGDADAFPNDPTQWKDSDGDGFGDNASGNNPDDCPGDAGTSTIDRVGCPDRDGDGYSNAGDALPDDPSQWTDQDGDGYGDNASGNFPDQFPLDPTQWGDSDDDGYGDNPVGLFGDWWPNDPSQWQDADGDGFGDNTSGTDGDQCPSEYGEAQADDIRGCPDSDGDGVVDVEDAFPEDPFQWADEDEDGVGDNGAVASGDDCPGEYGTSSISPIEGCPDSDGDGWADSIDIFPDDEFQWRDSDGDTYGDNHRWENNTIDDPESPGNFILLRMEYGDAFPDDSSQWNDRDGDGRGDNPNGTMPDAFPNRVTQQTDIDLDGFGDNITRGSWQPDDCRSDYGTSWRDRYGCPDVDGDGQSDHNDICEWDKNIWVGTSEDCEITGPSTAGNNDDTGSQIPFGLSPMYIIGFIIALLLVALFTAQAAKQSAKKSYADVNEVLSAQLHSNSMEDEARRLQWVDYYLSQGMKEKAKELGWEDPADLPQWQQHEIKQKEAVEASMPEMFDLDNLL